MKTQPLTIHVLASSHAHLADWWREFDGPAYPTGEQVADALIQTFAIGEIKVDLTAVDGTR